MKLIFGLIAAWIEMTAIFEFKMADNWSRTRMYYLQFLDSELHIYMI